MWDEIGEKVTFKDGEDYMVKCDEVPGIKYYEKHCPGLLLKVMNAFRFKKEC